MRVAFLTPEFVTENYFTGGLANYIYRTARELVKRRHCVYVFVSSNLTPREFEKDGIQVLRIPSGYWIPRLFQKASFNRATTASQWIDFSWQAFRHLKREASKAPFDIIQCPSYTACGIFTILFSKIPSVVRISSYGPYWNEKSKTARNSDVKLMEWLELLQLKISKDIFSPSYTIKNMVEKGVGLSDISVIRTPFYNETDGYDTSIYDKYLTDKRYILFYGRLQLHKGVYILAKALPRLLFECQDLHVTFVGKDCPFNGKISMSEEIQALCRCHSDRLVFVDQIPHSQLYPIIENARFVVLPSLADNLPNALLESMGLGKVVVGTKGSSFDEVIEDGKDGFLVDAGNVNKLAEKIIEVWKMQDIKPIEQAASAKSRDFRPETVISELVKYYEMIINKER